MKKIITLALSLMLILSCTVLSVSAATPSPEIKDIISSVEATQADGTKVDLKLEKADKVDADIKPEASDEKVIIQTLVKVSGTPTYPLNLSVKIDGVKKTSRMYVLAKDEAGSVKKLETEILSDGVINVNLDKAYTSLAFVADIKTATQVGTSDKTGDATLPAVSVLMITSAAAIILAKKKLEEN